MRKVALFLVISFTSTCQAVLAQQHDQQFRNKEIVTRFYQQIFGEHNFSVIDTVVTEGYIQHNPAVADGRKAFKDAVVKWLTNAPKTKIDFRHAAAEGDLVFLHIRSIGPGGTITAIVDIFRLKNQKITEHWDVTQQVPTQSQNPHPMF